MSALSKASDCLDHFKDSALTGIVNVGVCLCIICLRRRGERTIVGLLLACSAEKPYLQALRLH